MQARQYGDSNYLEAESVTCSITVTAVRPLSPQTISLTDVPTTLPYGAAAVSLEQFFTAASGLPLSFEVVSGPASVSGSLLTLSGAGQVVVRAMRAGNENYSPATPVERTLTFEPNLASWKLGYFPEGETEASASRTTMA